MLQWWQAKAILPTLLTVVFIVSSNEGGSVAAARGHSGAHPSRPQKTSGLWSKDLETASIDGGYVIDRIDIFSPEDIGLLEGVGMLFGLGSGDISSILSLVKVGLGVVEFVDKIYSKVFNGSSIELDFNSNRGMLAMFEVLSYRLDQMNLGIQGIESSLRGMIRGLPHMLRWEVMLDSLEDYTRPINSLYMRFQLYQKHRNKIENHTARSFAESVVSHDVDSIMNLMANVHSMVAPGAPPLPNSKLVGNIGPEYVTVNSRVNQHYQNRYKDILLKKQTANQISPNQVRDEIGELSLRPSVFVMLEQVLKEYDQCELQQSDQQMLLGLYSLVSLTQARGFAMVNYAYMLLKIYKEGNFTIEQELSRNLYEHYSRTMLQQALQVISRASNTYHRCDPKEHVQGDTYVMFTELLQGHIENEVDLSSRGSCMNSCGSYDHARVNGCYLPDQQLCGMRKKCKGTLHHCKFIDADADMCFSSNPYRRFDWIHYENGHTLGRKSDCDDKQKVDSWYRWFVHCSYCICLCDDPTSETTDRYVSLLPTVTSLDDSMVLTGVKISKHNRVIMVEVQQGRTMPQGQVDPSSLNWIANPPIDVNSASFVNGVDYHTMGFEARSLDLDLVSAPPDHVITGVRFRMLGPHINLEVRVTPIVFGTGLMNSNMSYWKSNDNTPVMPDSPRLELKLDRPDDPAKSILPSEIVSKSDMFVEFQATDLNADVSQMTVPYFDAQPVTTSPASWLSGLYLYYKRSNRGSGGFVGLELHCYNATRHFLEDTPEPQIF